MQDQMPPQDDMNAMPGHGIDREGAMAKADLFKLANYSLKLFKQIEDEDQLEGWVQAKITKAADYIASVYHYLEYEMKFSEYGHHLDNSDTLSESQKAALKNMLMEAKSKVSKLKKAQAEKVKESKSSTGGEITKTKTGLRHTHNPDRFSDEPHGEVASKVKAQSAADKAGEKAADKAEEKEGKAWEKAHGKGSVTRVKDGKKVEEGFEANAKTGDTFKTKTGVATKTSTGVKHTNTKFSDEEHGEPASKVKARSAADKAGEKATDKAAEKESKAWGKANPGKQTIYKDGKKVNEAAKPDYIDADDDGDEKESMKKAFADKKKGPEKKVKEALKGGQKKLDADDDGDIEADDLADLRAKKEKKVDEAKAKPSAGLTKGQKSATVKAAKKGEDIGKPGKSFDKVAKAAGGGEKGEKIAAAAMWKNKAKSVKEGSIQGGVWVASPDKGVPAPSGDDDMSADTAPKKKQSVMPSRNKPATTPAPAPTKPQSVMPSRNTVNESVELDRIKYLSGL